MRAWKWSGRQTYLFREKERKKERKKERQTGTRDRQKQREGERERDRDRDREREETEREKRQRQRETRDRERQREGERDRDRDRERKTERDRQTEGEIDREIQASAHSKWCIHNSSNGFAQSVIGGWRDRKCVKASQTQQEKMGEIRQCAPPWNRLAAPLQVRTSTKQVLQWERGEEGEGERRKKNRKLDRRQLMLQACFHTEHVYTETDKMPTWRTPAVAMSFGWLEKLRNEV